MLTAGLLLSGLTALPAFAYTSHRAHTVLIEQHYGGTTERSTSATCPATQSAQFGGFGSGGAFVRAMRRSADNRWTVVGNAPPTYPSSPESRIYKVTSNVYCGDGPVPLEVSHSKRIGPSHAVAVTCPAGTFVLAGGFTSPNQYLIVSALERVASDRWRVEATYPRDAILTAIAYCGYGPPPKVVQSRTKLRGDGLKTTAATCPKGSSLVFGGALATIRPTTFPSQDWAAVAKMRASTSSRWSATGMLPNAGRGSITALAYCR